MISVSSCGVKLQEVLSGLEKERLKHWRYTCTFVAFLNITILYFFFFFLSTWGVIFFFFLMKVYANSMGYNIAYANLKVYPKKEQEKQETHI